MMTTPQLYRSVFLLLVATITVAFVWVLWPFLGAVFWGVVLALLFQPLHRRIRTRLRGHGNTAALLTLLLCLVIVILPMIMVGTSLVTEVTAFVQRAREGDFSLRDYVQHVMAALPPWVTEWLDRLGFSNLDILFDRISTGLLQGSQLLATRVLEFGQNTFQFLVQFVVMLYLLFFFLRDGQALATRIKHAIPLARAHTEDLLAKFATVVRATVKGSVVVAMVQGALGGLAFWALGIKGAVFWGVVMSILSLLPAVGAALVWAPVAIYLVSTGSVWQGLALTTWGVVVIGLSDNVLRPILVGKDTKLPDYVVLLTTLGGISLFGLTGFVIGPTIAALFIAVWDLFVQMREEDDAESNGPAD